MRFGTCKVCNATGWISDLSGKCYDCIGNNR